MLRKDLLIISIKLLFIKRSRVFCHFHSLFTTLKCRCKCVPRLNSPAQNCMKGFLSEFLKANITWPGYEHRVITYPLKCDTFPVCRRNRRCFSGREAATSFQSSHGGHEHDPLFREKHFKQLNYLQMMTVALPVYARHLELRTSTGLPCACIHKNDTYWVHCVLLPNKYIGLQAQRIQDPPKVNHRLWVSQESHDCHKKVIRASEINRN